MDDLSEEEFEDLVIDGRRIEVPDLEAGVPSCRRQTIMEQLLNELLVTNEWFEKEHTHPFSALEVIIEEVTPCSSSQQLENNLSTIKAGLPTHHQNLQQEFASDSDDRDVQREFYYGNTLKKNDNYNSDDSSGSPKTIRKYNESNTSNTNGESYKDFDRNKRNKKLVDCKQDSESSVDSRIKSVNKQSLEEKIDDGYRRYEQFINDDDRYIRGEKANRKSKFLNLNKNYERSSKKSASTTNIKKLSDKVKKSENKVQPSNINKKENKLPWKQKSDNNKKISKTNNKQFGSSSFTCLNTYAIKNPPIHYSSARDEYTETLEDRLQYFKTQCSNLEKELTQVQEINSNFTKRFVQKSDTSSEEDDRPWQAKSSLKDRGDFTSKKILVRSNFCQEISPEESSVTPKNISYIELYDSMENDEQIQKEDRPSFSGTIFITETPDSGLQTHSSKQNLKNIEEEMPKHCKVLLPNRAKNVATQITDQDWQHICHTKKEMSERGYLRLNLPNSSDDEILDEIEESKRSDILRPITVINSTSDSTRITSQSNSVNISVDATDREDVKWTCFPCSNIIRCFSKR